MRRRLVVLRHAKSAWPEGVADHERPLAERGRREAPLVGRWLDEHAPDIDLVVCSSAKRARQTWTWAAEGRHAALTLRIDERVYAASARDLMIIVGELPDEVRTALLIGHNPGLEDLVRELAGTWCTLKTSTVAVLSGPGDWADVAPGWATLDATATLRP